MRFVKFVDMQLTSTQILALHTAAIDVIPAQGAGNVAIPIGGIMSYDHGETEYDDNPAAATNFVFKYGAGDICCGKVPVDGFCNAAADKIAYFGGEASLTGLVSATADTAITVTLGGAITNGDGPINIRVAYAVLPSGL